jgi:hypothetical protein
MLTKEIIQKMKEDELSQKVLIPLFREMGFQDVVYYHGGAGEQGKDIVFWEHDKLQTRKNYAVVVKATNITGQAKAGKGTAGEVATQIQQAFGDDYLDSVTSESQTVHECWVVTNLKISKEGETSIKSVMKASNYHRHVRFINGDKLWELVEKHLARQTLMGKFQMIQKEISNVDSHYVPVIQLSGEEMNLGLREKFKGAAEEKPLDFNFSFQFPETPAGQAAKVALDQHFATGAPVSISPEFISSIEYPELIKSLFGADDIQTPTLEISPLSNGHHFVARIEIECDDGDKFNIDHVDFVVKHSGTEEATLENIESASILKIKLVVNMTKHTAKLTFGWHLPNQTYSCAQLLQILEFQNCSSKPFNLRVISKEFGLEVFSQRSEQGTTSSPPKFHLSLYRVLDKLQRKSNKLIMIPIRALTDDEIKDLSELIHIVHNGKITGKWTEFKVTLQDLSVDAFKALSEQAFFFRLVAEEVENIFATELPLGEVETVFRNGLIANLGEARKAYNSGERNVELHIVAQNGEAEFEKIYSEFASSESDKGA